MAAQSDATPASLGEAAAEKVNVLIVDDRPEKLLVLRAVLEELDQNLVLVSSGTDALREVMARDFAVILLDVNMPDIDGLETAALIRGYRRSAHTPIIFVTAYADEVQTLRGYSLGAVDYILAPVVPQVLRSKVQVFVQLFALQRQLSRQADAHAAFLVAEAGRRVAEHNVRRAAFVSHASQVLNRSLQVADVVRDLAGLIVPQMADLAVVLVADGGTAAGQVLVATGAGAQVPAATVELREADLGEAVAAALQAALRDKKRADLTPAQLAQLGAGTLGPSLSLGLPAGLSFGSVVPLLNGDRLLGAFLAAKQDRNAPDAAPDWSLLDESLAPRAAAALENAQLYGSLQREIDERMAVEAELQEASRRKDEFLAMLSHELRNPLAPIRIALELVRRIAPPDPKINWATDVMARQLRQLTRLIEELLDVARISQGKIVLKREKVDLNAVISHSIETAQPFIDAREQKLRVTLFAEPMWMQGDPARLAQIVLNLLNNASKYSDKGTLIELMASLDAQGPVIRVRDQGIGIDADLLPRIFDLFRQGQRGLDRAQGGLGVGLTLARRLAEMHGGSLQAFSEGRGLGSEFRLRLPGIGLVGSRLAPAPAPTYGVSAPVVGHCRILVVDDNRDAAQTVAQFLASEGHEIRTAADGVEALEAAHSFVPDVVVLDIGLPRLDGYDVARQLRQWPATRGALLIALTGYGQAQDRECAEQAGFDHHFVKPADPGALISCIAAWLAGLRSATGHAS